MRLDYELTRDDGPTGNGDLGTNSNNSIDNDPGSRLVFRARSATFATMIFCLLWLAFEVMDLRRSFFHMGRAGTEKRYVSLSTFPSGGVADLDSNCLQSVHAVDVRRLGQPASFLEVSRWHPSLASGVARELADNSLNLVLSVVLGFVITFPLVYIPGLNEVVFRHTSIGWEWAPAFIAFLIFAAGVEGWKYCKRVYFRRRHASHPEEDDGMTGIFAAWKTTAVTDNIEAV